MIITSPAYLNSLATILDDTSSDVLEAYLVVRAALTLSPRLGTSTEAWQAQRFLQETLTGIKKGAVGDRAEYCIGKVEQSLGFAAGRYFVNETFAGESREKGTKVITGLSLMGCPELPVFNIFFLRHCQILQEISTRHPMDGQDIG